MKHFKMTIFMDNSFQIHYNDLTHVIYLLKNLNILPQFSSLFCSIDRHLYFIHLGWIMTFWVRVKDGVPNLLSTGQEHAKAIYCVDLRLLNLSWHLQIDWWSSIWLMIFDIMGIEWWQRSEKRENRRIIMGKFRIIREKRLMRSKELLLE